MRLLQYKLQLAEKGYFVASGEIRYQEVACPAECLPIRLTILEPEVDHAVENIADVITNDPEFRRSCKRVLLGEYPGCYLYAFEVQPTHIVLSYTHGTIILGSEMGGAELRFDVPHKSAKSDSTYTVSLCYSTDLENEQKKHTACVHEDIGDIHRELLFEQIGETMDFDNHYVFVDEYVDL